MIAIAGPELLLQFEAEAVAIEPNRGADVTDDISDCGHDSLFD